MSIDEKEKIAELCHKQWSGWIKYMFSKCSCHARIDGIRIIPGWAVKRWARQANTPYVKLTPEEQESDRKEADKFLTLLKQPKDQPSSELTDWIRSRKSYGEYTTSEGSAKILDLCDRLDTSEAENRRVNAGWAMESQLRENLLQENYSYEVGKKALQTKLETSEASRKELLTALEEAADDFYYIHQHPEDAHTDSYNFMEKAKQAAKQS